MSVHKEELCCAFNEELPCPVGCSLRNFRLRTIDRYSTEGYSISPGEESKLIANCPPRPEEGEPRVNTEEDSEFLKKYCLHFAENL